MFFNRLRKFLLTETQWVTRTRLFTGWRFTSPLDVHVARAGSRVVSSVVYFILPTDSGPVVGDDLTVTCNGIGSVLGHYLPVTCNVLEGLTHLRSGSIACVIVKSFADV